MSNSQPNPTGPAVVVLGGAGEMGSRAVEVLSRSRALSRVTVADRDSQAGYQLSRRLRGQPAEVGFRRVDATDPRELVRVMSGHQVAASALGPFHHFEVPLVQAALEARVNYASICDEWQPTAEVLDRFAEPARQRGLTLITGLGASPGLTNLGARHLSCSLDVVQSIEINVFLPMDAGGGPAVLDHLAQIVSGEMVVWRHGGPARIAACSEQREVDFPRFGRVRVWNMGHPEPLTLPRVLPGVGEVAFRMGFGRGTGLLAAVARVDLLEKGRPLRRLLNRAARLTAGAKQSSSPGAVRADAWGFVQGKPATRMLCGVADMREATGVSLAVGTEMLAERQLTVCSGGVHPPEACLDPGEFFRRMAAQGLFVYDDLEMKRPIWKS